MNYAKDLLNAYNTKSIIKSDEKSLNVIYFSDIDTDEDIYTNNKLKLNSNKRYNNKKNKLKK